MPDTTHVLDKARELVKKRLAELDDERKRLERALSGLDGKAARRAPGRPRKAVAGPAPRRRRGRKGNRAGQAVTLIEKQPGITASEIAKAMKIKPNYLYRVLGDLEKQGRVQKDGRRYSPVG